MSSADPARGPDLAGVAASERVGVDTLRRGCASFLARGSNDVATLSVMTLLRLDHEESGLSQNWF
jgi:hypothetical protein